MKIIFAKYQDIVGKIRNLSEKSILFIILLDIILFLFFNFIIH